MREELEPIQKNLVRFSEYRSPEHLVIYGPRGAGKTTCLRTLCRDLTQHTKGRVKVIYVNARSGTESSYKLYQEITGNLTKGMDTGALRRRAGEILDDNTIIIIDEVDNLRDTEALYFIAQETNAEIIALTQRTYWFRDQLDSSIQSRMHPRQEYFPSYTSQQIYEIIKTRAAAGLHRWDNGQLHYIAALTVRDFQGDARIAIQALKYAGIADLWTEESITEAMATANQHVEGDAIKHLPDRELLILSVLAQQPESPKAYRLFVQRDDYIRSVTQRTWQRSIDSLVNAGLVSKTATRIGRSTSIIAEPLMHNNALIVQEIRRRDLSFIIEPSSPKGQDLIREASLTSSP